MVRYRISFLLLVAGSVTARVAAEEPPNAKTPDSLIETLTKLLGAPAGSSDRLDLTASASEGRSAKYLPPPPGSFRGQSKSCYDCNSEPWIPIVGRSLNFPSSSHTNNLFNNHVPHFREKGNNKQFNVYHPPIDQYGAPQAGFNYPPIGEVVDFMLPPPFKTFPSGPSSFYGSPKPVYGPPKPVYGPPKPVYGPPKPAYGPPTLNPNFSPPPLNYNIPPPTNQYGPPVTHLSMVPQNIHPPLSIGAINTLPLESNLPPAQPSDSYGRPLPSDSYGAPTTNRENYLTDNYGAPIEPITLGSGDSGDYKSLIFSNFGTQYTADIKNSLHHKGMTDVQVLPSVRIADYTASIEHPINIIQSPVLDLNVDDQPPINNEDKHETEQKLSENPIVVDDAFTSASDINTTYSASEAPEKRHNDKYLSSEPFGNNKQSLEDQLIQKLLLEHNVIPQADIVGIQKGVFNPQENLSWPTAEPSTVVMPPQSTTWLSPINASYSFPRKQPKKQIIIPYLKAPAGSGYHSPSTAIYNREYTTLAPVFVPPPISTEPSSFWPQLVDDLRNAETQKEPAHGFQKSTTEVYNIKDFLGKQQQLYDIVSLQKNIDQWTQQAYMNLHQERAVHAKKIPGEYFTTTPAGHTTNTISYETKDHLASSSEQKEYISKEIEDNLVSPEDEPSTVKPVKSTTAGSVRFIVRRPPTPIWDHSKVTLSNSTHEKVYLVTPQSYVRHLSSTPATAFSMAPKIQNGEVNNVTTMTRIDVRIEPSSEEVENKLKPIKVVYSEWPHIINDLATTTTPKPTSRHPLFGQMDMAQYTDPPNATVQTLGGHSKVVSVGTSPIVRSISTTPLPTTKVNGTVRITASVS